MKTKSKYKRKRALHGTTEAKTTGEKVKDSVIQTGKDLLIGVIGGGIAGAVIGKSSLLIGAGVSGYGHYANKPMLTTFGIGMMAASGFNAGTNATNGVDGFSKEDIKTRLMNFKDSFTSKLFLDKIIKKKTEESANGVGAVQYYEYPNENKELDFSSLDRLQNQIVQSGIDYKKNMQGIESSSEESAKAIYGNDDAEMDFTTPTY
ncbi:MAG: hypothetical protein Q7W13_09555 [Bacteroidia bacterium]|nr:hypothetical protein [Bacteroidia bacterium]